MSRPPREIRVLVVDDSALARDLIRYIVTSEPGITVAGEAADGARAVEMAALSRPDLVTMDIEMPVLGGLDAIERIMARHPVPILVVTALKGVRTAFAAVSKGALEVMEKPDISPENARKLIDKIRVLADVDVSRMLPARGRAGACASGRGGMARRASGEGIVAIAASTGGPQAIQYILSHLPATFPAPIVITQHIAEGFTRGMVEWLNGSTPLTVVVAGNGDRLAPGRVYVNPAEHFMRITGQGMIILGDRDAGLPYHPSCDTLLGSVAAAYGERAVGLILSGMGEDGVAGMRSIGKAGGVTMAQDAGSSLLYGMNRMAVELGLVDRVLPLSDIPAELLAQVGGS